MAASVKGAYGHPGQVAEVCQEAEVAAKQVLRRLRRPFAVAVAVCPGVQSLAVAGEAVVKIIRGGGLEFFVP